MLEWWRDYLVGGFSAPVYRGPIEVFRYGLGVAMLTKFSFGILRGGWTRLTPGGLNDRLLSAHLRAVARLTYRPSIVAGVAGSLMILGPLPRLGAILVFAALVVEQIVDSRSHSKFQAVLCALLLSMPALARSPVEAFNSRLSVVDDGWAAGIGMILVAQLYLSSAFHKARSRQFMPGHILSDLFLHRQAVSQQMVRFEYAIPRRVHQWLGDEDTDRRRRIFRAAALGTVVAEVALPTLLLAGGPYAVVGVAFGILMHVAFNVILPVQLASFALACWSGYALYFAPVVNFN